MLLLTGAAAASFALCKRRVAATSNHFSFDVEYRSDANAVAANNSNPTASAQSAAPAAIASQASIVITDASGAMQTDPQG